jgi:hypothetical protein
MWVNVCFVVVDVVAASSLKGRCSARAEMCIRSPRKASTAGSE